MVTGSKPIRAAAPTSKSSLAKDSRHHLFDETQFRPEVCGKAAEILQVPTFLTRREFQNLLEGYSPDGKEKLVQNAGDPKRQAGTQFTLTVPKAVSVAYALGSSDIKFEFVDSHLTAAKKALEHGQEFAALTKHVEHGSVAFERVAIMWVLFTHIESQALDPHLHSHAYLINVGIRQDGSTCHVRNNEFFDEIKNINAIYEVELAHQLRTRLGLTITPLEKKGFKIEGIPDDLCREFSKRRSQIEEEMQRRGSKNPKALSYAAKSTRQDKVMLSHEALFSNWERRAKALGYDAEKIQALVSRSQSIENGAGAFKSKFEEVAKRHPKPTRKLLVNFGRKNATAHGATGDDLRDAFREHLPKSQPFVHVEWRELKKAPFWSPTKLVKLPRIVVGNPKEIRRWGDVLRESSSALGKARIQERYLFPNAPRWSPFHKWQLPALRYGKMRLSEKEVWGDTRWKANLAGGELRVQERRVFPRSLSWNPTKNLKVPVPRFVSQQQKSASEKFAELDRMQQNH